MYACWFALCDIDVDPMWKMARDLHILDIRIIAQLFFRLTGAIQKEVLPDGIAGDFFHLASAHILQVIDAHLVNFHQRPQKNDDCGNSQNDGHKKHFERRRQIVFFWLPAFFRRRLRFFSRFRCRLCFRLFPVLFSRCFCGAVGTQFFSAQRLFQAHGLTGSCALFCVLVRQQVFQGLYNLANGHIRPWRFLFRLLRLQGFFAGVQQLFHTDGERIGGIVVTAVGTCGICRFLPLACFCFAFVFQIFFRNNNVLAFDFWPSVFVSK